MDEKHKDLLKKYQDKFYQDLIVIDNFMQQLVREGVFSENLASLIKAERSNDGKVQKLLEILPKRGPEAFGKFLKVLQEDYDWMAKDLSDLERQETDNSDTRITSGGGGYDCDNENGDRESTNSSTLEDEHMPQEQYKEENSHHGQEVRKVRSQEQRLRVDISNLTRQVKDLTDEKTELEDAIKESLGFLPVRCDDETESSLALVLIGRCRKMMKENESEKKKSTELSKQKREYEVRVTELEDMYKQMEDMYEQVMGNRAELSRQLDILNAEQQHLKNKIKEALRSWDASFHYLSLISIGEHLIKRYKEMEVQIEQQRRQIEQQRRQIDPPQQGDCQVCTFGSRLTFHRQTSIRRPKLLSTHDRGQRNWSLPGSTDNNS